MPYSLSVIYWAPALQEFLSGEEERHLLLSLIYIYGPQLTMLAAKAKYIQ